MSYTIPDSVQTKAEAVLAVASAIADEDMGARYDGTVNTSLDVLADVLAAQDVQVPQTNAGAILALAQYAHGGGGGGGGDFTTASVAFIIDGYTGSPFVFPVPVIDPDDGLFSYITSSDMDGDNPYDVVMYNGELLLEQPVDGARFAASTGSIELQGGGAAAIITGDGTLTISNEE